MRILPRLVLIALLTAAPAAEALAQPRALVFGVLNQQSPSLTAERWNPVLHYVSTVSGVPLKLAMGRTVQETNTMMGRGEFDFVFTNHNFQPEFDDIPFTVIARWAGDPIRAVIAVPMDSPVQRLADLSDRRVSFPSADAFVGYAVPMLALRKAGVSVETVYGGNQEGSLAQLKAGWVAAAAVNSRYLRRYMDREGVRFREVYLSDPYPDLAVIAHPRVPATTVDRVRKALLGMASDPGAAGALSRAECKGFEPATNADYAAVRRVYRQIGP
jgi:phosphonate transport system substrate-binding protein